MKELFEKKKTTEQIMRYILIICAVAGIVIIAFASSMSEFAVLYILLWFWFIVIFFLVYMIKFLPYAACSRWLKKLNMENIGDDISLEQPTLPKSKLYCGSRAVFAKKTNILLPYSEFSWVYKHVVKEHGITILTNYFVGCRSGKMYSIKANEQEFMWFLNNYIVPVCPDLLMGYTSQNAKEYKQRVKIQKGK